MPTIQLSGDGLDHARVLARMYFPADEARHGSVLNELCTPPAAQGRPRLRISNIAWRASMAGDVLLRVVVLGHIGDSEPSVRKALFSLRNFAIGLRSDENGEQLEGREFKAIPDTEESLRHYWSQYRAVAHFWAAHRVLEQIVPFFEIPAALSEDALLQQFLGHSEWFLQFGLGKTSRNDKVGTLLELAGMWVCRPRPDALEPELEYAVASVQEQVKDYRAH